MMVGRELLAGREGRVGGAPLLPAWVVSASGGFSMKIENDCTIRPNPEGSKVLKYYAGHMHMYINIYIYIYIYIYTGIIYMYIYIYVCILIRIWFL